MLRDCSSCQDFSQEVLRFNRKRLGNGSFEKRRPYQAKPIAVETVDPNRTYDLNCFFLVNAIQQDKKETKSPNWNTDVGYLLAWVS